MLSVVQNFAPKLCKLPAVKRVHAAYFETSSLAGPCSLGGTAGWKGP